MSATSLVEPPYGIILAGLRSGRVIPFLGAAASRIGPSDRQEALPPSGTELAEVLASRARFPSVDPRDREDLAKVSSYYVDVSSRSSLRTELRTIFLNEQFAINELHRLLARIAEQMVVVTTNYDTLLEDAFSAEKKEYDVVVYPADNLDYANSVLWWVSGQDKPKRLRANEIDFGELGKKNLIYKMHGGVSRDSQQWDGFVITEEDYVKFLSRTRNAVPSAFRTYFSGRSFLFLGYGLQDWNLRVLLKQMGKSASKSWAILKEPSAYERILWLHRDVVIYNTPLEEFVSELQKEMRR